MRNTTWSHSYVEYLKAEFIEVESRMVATRGLGRVNGLEGSGNATWQVLRHC